MSNGWIALHRKILNWEWWDDHNTTRLFLYLLLKANHEPKKWRGIQIERGQLVTGRIALSEETGISQQSVRTSLKRLKSTNELTIKSTSKYSLITITNYSDYQDKGLQVTSKSTNKLTINQPATNHKQQLNNKTNKQINIKSSKNFKKPTTKEVEEYCGSRGNGINAERFINYYESVGWMVGKKKMKDWKAAVRTWENRSKSSSSSKDTFIIS